MRCKSYGWEKTGNFTAETLIHFKGLQNIDVPPVWVFPELLVCLDCGTAQFVIPKEELPHLQRGKAAGEVIVKCAHQTAGKTRRFCADRIAVSIRIDAGRDRNATIV